MDIIAALKSDLLGRPHREWRAVAAACGLSYYTLRSIVYGSTPNPRYLTVEKIRSYYGNLPPRPTARADQVAVA